MKCDRCPHQAEINAALTPCQTCEHAHTHHGGGYDAACLNCPTLKVIQKAMRPCDKCEAGKLHGEVHLDAAPEPFTVLAHAVPNDHTPMPGVTELPPDVEDALRKALCVLMDFDPVKMLLIQHVAHGRTPSAFRKTLLDLRERLNNRYDLSEGSKTFRQICCIWKKRIVEDLPALENLFDEAIANGRGQRECDAGDERDDDADTDDGYKLNTVTARRDPDQCRIVRNSDSERIGNWYRSRAAT